MTDLRTRLVRLLQNPKVAGWLSDPRVRYGLMAWLRLRSRIGSLVEGRLDRAARAMNLATERDVRELKRTIRRLEERLRQSEANGARIGRNGSEH